MGPCSSCVFFHKNAERAEMKEGFCHRHPPTVFLKGDEYRSIFTPVREEFGCGEFRPAGEGAPRRRRRAVQ